MPSTQWAEYEEEQAKASIGQLWKTILNHLKNMYQFLWGELDSAAPQDGGQVALIPSQP